MTFGSVFVHFVASNYSVILKYLCKILVNLYFSCIVRRNRAALQLFTIKVVRSDMSEQKL